MTSINKSKANDDLGNLGEDLVARWLQLQGFQILARRWHCLGGEIDIIAFLATQTPKNLPKIAFVEVKTRSQHNWDAGGLLAVTSSKQAKIKRSAALFLSKHPDLADCACQFDVALVSYSRYRQSNLHSVLELDVAVGKSISLSSGTLCLEDYLEFAFE